MVAKSLSGLTIYPDKDTCSQCGPSLQIISPNITNYNKNIVSSSDLSPVDPLQIPKWPLICVASRRRSATWREHSEPSSEHLYVSGGTLFPTFIDQISQMRLQMLTFNYHDVYSPTNLSGGKKMQCMSSFHSVIS